MRSSSGNGGGSASFSTSTRGRADLDLAGRQVGVDRALGPGPHRRPSTRSDVLAAHAVRRRRRRRGRGRRRPARCPATSRTSRNTTPPWSRRPSTQPQTTTSRPMSVGRGDRRRDACASSLVSSVFQSFRNQPATSSPRHLDLLAATAGPSPRPRRRSASLLAEHARPHARAGPVGRLQLRLQRPAAVRAVGARGRPRAARSTSSVTSAASSDAVDDEHVGRRLGAGHARPRRRTRSARARCRCRTRCRAWAGRPSPRPARRSGRRRRSRSARRRARRSRTRTWCSCSSRGRGRAAGAISNAIPSACEPVLHRLEVRRAASSLRYSVICGARSMTSCQSGRFESRTRSGLASTRSRNVVAERVAVLRAGTSRSTLDVAGPRSASSPIELSSSVTSRRPSVAVEAVRERDDLDVDVGVVDAEHLDADLPVLAVAALLRPLVAEVRRDVPDLPRRRSGGAARTRARPTRCPRAAARGGGRPCRRSRTSPCGRRRWTPRPAGTPRCARRSA